MILDLNLLDKEFDFNMRSGVVDKVKSNHNKMFHAINFKNLLETSTSQLEEFIIELLISLHISILKLKGKETHGTP